MSPPGFKLAGARLLLTGAAGGIGQAAAEALAARGAGLLLSGRRAEPLKALAEALAARHGGSVGPVPASGPAPRFAWAPADLARPDDLARLAAQADALPVDGVVHNAGAPAFGRFEAADPAELAAVLHTNLLAPLLLTQALLPGLRRRPKATVVAIGSALGRLGLPGHVAYGASKFGLRGFCEALRRELAGSPVAVQHLGPRAVQTGFNSPAAEAHRQASGARADPPDRVAQALVRLIESGRPEAWIGWPERLAGPLNALAPALLDGALGRQAASLPQA